MSPTVKDFLGFVVNPPPGDPSLTAFADQLPGWLFIPGAQALSPSGGDDSSIVQSAITSFGSAGGIITLGPGTFLWNSAPVQLPRNTPLRIQGSGIGKTIIRLSTGAPRAFDFGKVADYDVFAGIELLDFTVDANNTGGRHHVVLGTYIGNAQQTRISVNRLTLRRIRTINVPTDPTTTNHRPNVFVVPVVNAADNPCTLLDHVYEDLDFLQGGNIGLNIGGTTVAGPCNLTWDRISIVRVKHDTGQTWNGPAGYSSSNMLVGSQAPGGKVTIDDCYGANSGDVGIEIDNHSNLVISRTRIQDAFTTEYLYRTFAPPLDGAQKQIAVYDTCEARVVNQQLAEANNFQSTGWYLGNASDPQAGTFVLRDCKYINTTPNLVFGPSGVESVGAAVHTVGPMLAVILERFTAVAENLSMQPADNQQPRTIALNHSGNSLVRVKGLKIRLAGAKSGGAGTLSMRVFAPSGGAGDVMTVNIEDYELDLSVTGLASGYGLLPGFKGGTIRGTIRRMRIVAQGDATSFSNYIFISGTPTVSPRLLIADCDFTNGLTNSDISVPAAAAPRVYYQNIVWHAFPKPSAAMSSANFATGTFVSGTGNQYIGGFGATIQMTGGAGITAVDVSKDGTIYDNVLTQASGALAQTLLFHVDNGDYVRVTFATTQPVTRMLPDK